MTFTIYKKLLLGFASVISLLIAANVYVLWQLSAVTETTSATFASDVRSINLAKQAQTVLFEEERMLSTYLVRLDTVYIGFYRQQSTTFRNLADSLYEASPNEYEVGLLFRLRNAHKWMTNRFERSVANPTGQRPRDNVIFDTERGDTLEAMHSVLEAIIQSNEQDVSSSVARIGDAMVRSSNVAWLITVGALLVAVMVALLITRSIVRPIRILIKGTENIARGIFDPIEVRSRDEMAALALAINDMSAKLKQINDLKTEMLHHISHELRTPLQTMLSAQYLLAEQKRGPLNDDQLRLVSSIKEGVKKLTIFSNQFLDIQKIEHGSMEYHFTRVPVRDVLVPAVEDAALIASQKDVQVALSGEDELPVIMADEEKISQVFTNLLSNAIKYTDAGGTITVTAARYKKTIRIAVADTGTGIPKDDLPRIFTKFYQAKNAKKGTGIGLALVKHLVEAHKGRIWLESELGKGTTFTVEFPAAVEAPKKPAKNTVTEEST